MSKNDRIQTIPIQIKDEQLDRNDMVGRNLIVRKWVNHLKRKKKKMEKHNLIVR